ncbi:hypothetical protein ACWCXC_31865 [Streptomyces sp. NPDC001515]
MPRSSQTLTRRDDLIAMLRNGGARVDSTAEYVTNAFAAEVIAARDAQIIAWLEKKAREEGTANKNARVRATAIYRMADKLSRGDEFEEADEQALVSLRRLTGGAA